MRKKVLVVQPLLAHYRKSLFQRLVASNDFDIQVVAGKQINNIKEIESGSTQIIPYLDNRTIKIGGHMFIWQAGVVKYTLREKPDLVVLTGVDPHIVSNLWLSLICRLFLKTKVVWWGHADLEKKGSFGKAFRLFFFNLSIGVLAYNDVGKRSIESAVNKKVKVASIRNCINEDEYGYNQSFSLPEGMQKSNGITILFSGRITREKRLDILIEALSILKDRGIEFKCIIIGDGYGRKEIESLIAFYNLSGMIELTGEQYEKECYPYFIQADLFVLPGKVGLSIIHGLSYGLPILTSDMLEIHSPEYEIIEKGYNGDFFEKFDPKDLAAKIISWSGRMQRDGGENIRKQCIASIIDGGYTPESMSKKMIDFFKILNN